MPPPEHTPAATIRIEEIPYIPISKRPEWADITPLIKRHQTATMVPDDVVVSIATDPEHSDLLACFWAVLQAQECSQRVLDLTEEIITGINSAHYTVWEWRWRSIVALGAIAGYDDTIISAPKENTDALTSTEEKISAQDHEAMLMQRVAIDNPKNYQLWNHRRKYAMARGAAFCHEEMEFSAACIASDAKNYHAWAHRQAILVAFATRRSELWEEEFSFTEFLLRDDARNNSAWNQRFFVINHVLMPLWGTRTEKEPLSQRAVQDVGMLVREIEFAISKIKSTPHNEAAWEYLKATATLLSKAEEDAVGRRSGRDHARGATAAEDSPGGAMMTADKRVRDICLVVASNDPCNAPALNALAEWYERRAWWLQRPVYGGHHGDEGERRRSRSVEAMVYAQSVAERLWKRLMVVDPIRREYYRDRLLFHCGDVCSFND